MTEELGLDHDIQYTVRITDANDITDIKFNTEEISHISLLNSVVHDVDFNTNDVVKIPTILMSSTKVKNNGPDYKINTQDDFLVIKKYLEYYSKNNLSHDYIKDVCVRTDNPHHIFNEFDTKLLTDYVEEHAEYKLDNMLNDKINRIACFKPLLSTCDYLQLNILAKKINIYCATIVWSLSPADYDEFAQLQNIPNIEEETVGEVNDMYQDD